jgi:hypothetical protein
MTVSHDDIAAIKEVHCSGCSQRPSQQFNSRTPTGRRHAIIASPAYGLAPERIQDSAYVGASPTEDSTRGIAAADLVKSNFMRRKRTATARGNVNETADPVDLALSGGGYISLRPRA